MSSLSAAALVACAPEAVFVAGADGRLWLANPAATALLGIGPGEPIERSLRRTVSAEEGRRFLTALQEATEEGLTRSAPVSWRNEVGEVVPTVVTASAVREPGGAATGAIAIMRDMRDAQARRAALERRAYTLERIIEERTRDLRRANQAKDEFLAVLSHELRTPLTPILTWAQILRRERNDDAVRQAADVIERNVRLQISLVEDLLDLTRLTQGTLSLDRARQDLRAVVSAALGTIAEQAADKGIRVEWLPPALPVVADVDGERIGQVLASILSNAIKFTAESGGIRVTLGQHGDAAVVRIADDGAGIHPEFLPFVFEMFRQQEEGARRQYGGLGVGLALAKRLVEVHGGTIAVKSDGIGRGTEVTVRLPVSNLRAEPARPARGAGAAGRLDGLRILLVEDSADTGDATRLLLESVGARVVLAKNGLDALAILGTHETDAILCDLRMPGLDGFEFLRRLRAGPGHAQVPVIAVSGFARAIDVQRTREAGFDGHVSKPFDYETLLATLQRALRDREERRTAA